jgi:phosphoenolpyruvate-protein kinase (PTS system EI component)
LGIPAVSGIQHALARIPRDREVLLNGGTGEVILSPTPDTLRHHPATVTPPESDGAIEFVPTFRVMANINLAAECPRVIAAHAEGIGLYRTEFECLSAGRMLSEDDQYARYRSLAEALAGQPLYVRLLDLGSDKSAPFLRLQGEENPCLGLRGARLLEERPEWFVPQARAIARASAHGPIHVVYPMVVDVAQFTRLKELFVGCTSDISGASLLHGPMFEVPAACLEADALLDCADFGSIGTNDLIQYLLAVDRNNSLVARDYDASHPALWTTIRHVARAARRVGKPLSVCGEIGGQAQYLARLLEVGINAVSVSIRMIGPARQAIRQHLSAVSTS